MQGFKSIPTFKNRPHRFIKLTSEISRRVVVKSGWKDNWPFSISYFGYFFKISFNTRKNFSNKQIQFISVSFSVFHCVPGDACTSSMPKSGTHDHVLYLSLQRGPARLWLIGKGLEGSTQMTLSPPRHGESQHQSSEACLQDEETLETKPQVSFSQFCCIYYRAGSRPMYFPRKALLCCRERGFM